MDRRYPVLVFFAILTALVFSPGMVTPAQAPKSQARPPSRSTTSIPQLNRQTIEQQIRLRADRYLTQKRLVVDYYRIGRQLAYPLPVDRVYVPNLPVPGIPDYPWEIWLSWELEERIGTLGWAAEWFDDDKARAAVSQDLAALARWPEFTPNGSLDLCLGHVARTLWVASTQWKWLDPVLQKEIGKALDRIVRDAAPWADNKFGSYQTAQDVLAAARPHSVVHNIPFIGLFGAALAANSRNDSRAAVFNRRLEMLLEALLQMRRQAYTEAVAYDGYLLDFAATWLQSLPAAQQKRLLSRLDFSGFFNQSYRLGAPGDITQVVEIGDVEPAQMPFHIAAQARLQALQPTAARGWYLSRCRPDRLRADALATLRPLIASLFQRAQTPPAGALDAHYVQVLRSGWAASDLAVAMAASNSPAGHLHDDAGSITIGLNGRWLVADPGYQQYMAGEERTFTLGPSAHNAPVINGRPQQHKGSRVRFLETLGKDLFRVGIDVTQCYSPDLAMQSVVRTVWLADNRLVVVADQFSGQKVETIAYHWHGHPEASWWVRDGWALLAAQPDTLWLTSPQARISDKDIDRLPGSRGQLTLTATLKPAPVVWWVFSAGDAPPQLESDPQGRTIRVLGRSFTTD